MALQSAALEGAQLRMPAEAPHFAEDPQECDSDFPNFAWNSFSPSRSFMAFRSSSFTPHFAWEPQLLTPQHFTSPCSLPRRWARARSAPW